MARKKPPDRTQRVRNERRALRKEMRALKETACSSGGCLAKDHDGQTVAKQGYSKFTSSQIANAKMVAAAAEDWAKANPDAYRYMCRSAEADVMADRRVSVSALVHDARRIDFVDSSGKTTRVDNTLASALARMLVRDVPGLADHIELRRCAVGFVMADGGEGVDHG